MLNINSISRGIVIDHINPGKGYLIFKFLELHKADYTVALIMNASSKKLGTKDMIKIENVLDIDLSILGLLDDSLTVNIIENEVIKEKLRIRLPEKVEDILTCNNPRCITSSERNIIHQFSLVDRGKKLYKCDYCDHLYHVEEHQNDH